MEGYNVTQQVDNGIFVARRIEDTFQWAEGPIGVGADQSDEAQVARVGKVLENIGRVHNSEENTANCTDGREPDTLASGEPVPLRPALPGASLVAAHMALEGVGVVPYTAKAADAVNWTVGIMDRAKLLPVAHEACWAGDNYLTTKENTVRFSNNEDFAKRQAQTMGINGIPYDERVQAEVDGHHRRQLRRIERYTDLTLDTFVDAAKRAAGDRGVASYKDDGRGVHGHVESDVTWLYAPGKAIDTRALNEAGEQAFTVNGDTVANMAKRLAFALRKIHLEVPLRHAINTHANVLHGSLITPGTPTWLIKKV